MAVNKIIYNGETLVDLTSDTVTADDLAAGVTATGADGKPVIGLLPKVTIDTELSTTSTNPVQNKTITAALSNLDIDIATNDEIDNALNLAGSGDLPTGGGGIVPIALGGTGATTTAGARTNLGVSATTDFAKVAFSGSYNDLTGTPTIPTATGDLTNNSGYITSSALNGYVKSVNGTSPDSNGNVSISVSGSSGSGGGNYTLPAANSSTLGGVKIGSNISVSDGTISITKSNVTSALGYTPPASDTTYGDATTTSSGLMSSTDKVKLNGIADNANYYIHPPTHPASMISGLATVATSGNYNDLANKPGDATTSSAGLMSAADKAKLDKVDADAGSVKLIIYS